MLTRFVLLAAVLLTAGCTPHQAEEDTGPSAPVSAPSTTTSGGTDDTTGPTPAGTPIALPANVCTLLDQVTVARLTGARAATATPSNQGPFHSCAYRVTTESGAAATAYLDVSDQRAAQLYDVATAGAQLSDLPGIGTRASLNPSAGKVYVLTTRAFFTLTLPITLAPLATPDGLRAAAQDLATTLAARLGP